MRLLRNRGFILLWTGQFLGTLTDWALRTVLLLWVYGLTRSGAAVGLVGLAEALPLLLLAPVAGVLVDRWSRAATMAWALVARAMTLGPLLLVRDRAGLPVILLVTLLANAASQFFTTAAEAAVPTVVAADQVGTANGVLSLIQGIVVAGGPGAAALLFAQLGLHDTILILGGLYLLAAPPLALVPAPRPVGATSYRPAFITAMADGVRYVGRSPLLVATLVVAFVGMLGFGALSVLDVVFVTRALRLPSTDAGALLSASGVGEALGGIGVVVASRWVAGRYHRLLGAAIVANGVGLAAYAWAPTLPAAAIVLGLTGTTFPPLLVSFTTILQRESDTAVLGRVLSLANTVTGAALILSTATGGVLADLVGVRQVIGGGAALLIGAGLLSLRVIRPAAMHDRGADHERRAAASHGKLNE